MKASEGEGRRLPAARPAGGPGRGGLNVSTLRTEVCCPPGERRRLGQCDKDAVVLRRPFATMRPKDVPTLFSRRCLPAGKSLGGGGEKKTPGIDGVIVASVAFQVLCLVCLRACWFLSSVFLSFFLSFLHSSPSSIQETAEGYVRLALTSGSRRLTSSSASSSLLLLSLPLFLSLSRQCQRVCFEKKNKMSFC